MKMAVMGAISTLQLAVLTSCADRKALNNQGGVMPVAVMTEEQKTEVSKAGQILIDSVTSELTTVGYSAELTDQVKSEAAIEISLANNLIVPQSISLALLQGHNQSNLGDATPVWGDATQSNLDLAADAVTVGALRAFSKYNKSQSAVGLGLKQYYPLSQILFTDSNTISNEESFISAFTNGQIRGLSIIKEQATVADVSPAAIASTIKIIARRSLESSLGLGFLTNGNAVNMSTAITRNLTQALHETSLKDSAEQVIPEVSKAIIGLKSLNAVVFSNVGEAVVKTLGASVKSNGLQPISASILPKVTTNTIIAAYEVSPTVADFAKVAGVASRAGFLSYAEINPVADEASGKAAADVIYGSAISAIDSLSILPVSLSTIDEIVYNVQKNAFQSIVEVGLTPNTGAAVLASTTETIINKVASLNQLKTTQVANTVLEASFDKIVKVAVEDIAFIAPQTTIDYQTGLQTTAFTTAKTNAVVITNNPPVVNLVIATPSTTTNATFNIPLNLSDEDTNVLCNNKNLVLESRIKDAFTNIISPDYMFQEINSQCTLSVTTAATAGNFPFVLRAFDGTSYSKPVPFTLNVAQLAAPPQGNGSQGGGSQLMNDTPPQ